MTKEASINGQYTLAAAVCHLVQISAESTERSPYTTIEVMLGHAALEATVTNLLVAPSVDGP